MASALFTRWFQSRVFTPGFLLPPAAPAPAPTQRVLIDILRLRSRFAPYVVSTGADQAGADDLPPATIPPALLKDYANAGHRLSSFSFGPSLLVQPAPAGEPGDLPVLLPGGSAWFDFWTGAAYSGGQPVRTPAPIDVLPLFVRAGTILPLAVVPETAGEAAEDTLELRIYPGADGRLVLAETPSDPDAAGVSASILLEWDDQARVLRIGARPDTGAARSLPSRFRIVLVGPGRGVGHFPPPRPEHSITYEGSELRLEFPAPPPPPLAPVGLVAKIQGDRIRFTWHKSCEGVIYRLKRVPGLNSPCEDLASGLNAPGHTIPVPVCGSQFSYFVTAINAGGESPPSAPVCVVHQPGSESDGHQGRLLPEVAPRASSGFSRLSDAPPGLARPFHPAANAADRAAPAGPADSFYVRAHTTPVPTRALGAAKARSRGPSDPLRPRP